MQSESDDAANQLGERIIPVRQVTYSTYTHRMSQYQRLCMLPTPFEAFAELLGPGRPRNSSLGRGLNRKDRLTPN